MGMIEQTYEHAVQVLGRCIDKQGMKASGMQEGYPQVWARDSMITFIGASLTGKEDFQECFKNSLDILGRYQSAKGYVPLNVDVRSLKIDTGNSGGVDSNLWYVIGHSIYFKRYGDVAFLQKNLQRIKMAVTWLEYQDSNDCGLLEVHEAADWADLLANRYNILYDNVLYYKALCEYGDILEACGNPAEPVRQKAGDIKKKLNILLWCGEPEKRLEMIEKEGCVKEWEYIVRWTSHLHLKYYLPYTAFRDCGYHCDGLANSLAVLFDIGGKDISDKILDYFIQTGMNKPYPMKALYPPIRPGDKDWREYYRCYNLNLPYQYHNGGIWPFIGGFYIAALVAAGRLQFAAEELENLAKANKAGKWMDWEFNEWLNGESGMPSGFGMQAWSAGMYVFAYQCVKAGTTDPFI